MRVHQSILFLCLEMISKQFQTTKILMLSTKPPPQTVPQASWSSHDCHIKYFYHFILLSFLTHQLQIENRSMNIRQLSTIENSEVTLFAPKSFVKIEPEFIYFPSILSLKFESCVGCVSDLSFISNNNRVESFPYSSILLVIFRDDGPSCEAVTD